MQRYLCIVAYDGSPPLHGSQAQGPASTLVTVEGALREAVRTLSRQDTAVVMAGRTDLGVHATGMAMHVDLPRSSKRTADGAIDPDSVLKAMTAALRYVAGGHVTVLSVRAVPPSFHARVSAASRQYMYALVVGSTDPELRMPFHRHRAWAVTADLDVLALTTALRRFVGSHDFALLCDEKAAVCKMRTVDAVDVRVSGGVALPAMGTALIEVRLRARSFLYHQIRCMVGAAVAVATGALSHERFKGLLAGTATAPYEKAPAGGLYFEAVEYPPEAIDVVLPEGTIYRPALPPGRTGSESDED